MKVNLNNLREKLCLTHDDIVNKLNKNIDDDGNLNISAKDIEKEFIRLRELIGAIAMVYIDDNPDFKDVFSELYNDFENMAVFNDDDEY